jgi:S1-C subfamily serine protease
MADSITNSSHLEASKPIEAQTGAAAPANPALPSDSDMAKYSSPATQDQTLKSDGNSLTFGSAYTGLSADASGVKAGVTSLIHDGESAISSFQNEEAKVLEKGINTADPYIGRIENAIFNKPGNLPSVVAIETTTAPTALGTTHSGGSGFFVTPDSIVTADHVVNASVGPIDIILSNGQKVEAKVSKVDAADDLALLKVTDPNANFPTLSVASDADVSPTENLYGHPYLLPQTNFTGTYDEIIPYAKAEPPGFVDPSSPDRNPNDNIDVFSLITHPGASGGPILNSQGAVVSVADAANAYYTLGIPAQDIQTLMNEPEIA